MTCTIYVTLVQVSGIACLGEGVTSLTASSFMGVVAMETWRPQKVWEENKGPCYQSLENMLLVEILDFGLGAYTLLL